MNRAELAVRDISGGLKEADFVLKGDLVIRNVTEFKAAFLDAEAKYTSLNFIFEDITRIDIPFIQLLVALKRNPGIKVSFQFEKGDYLNKWFAMAGLPKGFFEQ
ncbi:hypothetical protein [Desertivirga arenae]|uniref:hypothetical protein n=1 Tax=Desertivirga arenae TaxID=2810309 RepID=UPI001A968639|nr:hypothetical protein [Pedobacter sp. SYSU D00823]